MKNWEKYEKEIKELNSLAFSKNRNTFGYCENTVCDNCDFDETGTDCIQKKINWLYKEVKPILTKDERAFCEMFDIDSSGETYITRDAGGRLELWADKPINCDGYWSEADAGIRLDPSYFLFISYKDENPWSIADLLELEVE